jgi:hypothetical protein
VDTPGAGENYKDKLGELGISCAKDLEPLVQQVWKILLYHKKDPQLNKI